MPTVVQKLFVNIAEKRLQVSDINGGEVTLGELYKYQSLPLQVVLVEQDPDGELGQYERKSVSNLSLRISVNDTLDDASPLAQQASFTADSNENTLTGTLDLNTAGMTAYVGSASSVSAYLQIEFSESGGGWVVIYQQALTIKNSVTQPTTTSPSVSATYRTAEESDGIYLTPIARAGIQIGLRSPSNTKVRWLGVDDNGTAIDYITDWTP